MRARSLTPLFLYCFFFLLSRSDIFQLFSLLFSLSMLKEKSIADFSTLQSVQYRVPLNVKLMRTNEMYMTKSSTL